MQDNQAAARLEVKCAKVNSEVRGTPIRGADLAHALRSVHACQYIVQLTCALQVRWNVARHRSEFMECS